MSDVPTSNVRSLPQLLRDAERRVNAHVFKRGGDDSLASIPADPSRDVDILLMEAADEIERLHALHLERTHLTTKVIGERDEALTKLQAMTHAYNVVYQGSNEWMRRALAAERQAESSPVETRGDDRLLILRETLQQWLDFNFRERESSGIEANDDCLVMAPPVWPTRYVLKAWIKTLDDAMGSAVKTTREPEMGPDPVYCTTCGQEDRDCYCMPERPAAQAPIVRVTVRDGLCQRTAMYAPGLPDGEHDLFCARDALPVSEEAK